MHEIHIDVPRCADRCKDEQPRRQTDAPERGEVACRQQENEDHKPRQEKADRSLRENPQPRTGVCDVEKLLLPLIVPKKECRERAAEEDEEAHIREDELCEEGVEYPRPEDDRRPGRRPLIVEPPRKAIGQEESRRRKERREEPRSEVRHAERGERREQLPVKEDRLVVPVVPVDLRREPVPR